MKKLLAVLGLVASSLLFGCAALSGGPNPPIPNPSEMPSLPPMVTPTQTTSPTPAPTATPPQMSPEQAAAEACRSSFVDQIYAQYQPTYCSGMPPCTPKTTAELKAMISIDTRSAPVIGFTYTSGTLCSVITHYGRANFAPGECTLRSFTIDRQATEMVPC